MRPARVRRRGVMLVTSRFHVRLEWLATAVVVTGCGKGREHQAAAVPASNTGGSASPGRAPVAASTPRSGATLAAAGQLLTGSDPEAIRGYLHTVKEIQSAKFNVTWNPATVAIDRDAAMRSLRSISQDGSDYTFAASEPVVSKLGPGSILWIWDIAIRRVDSIATNGGVTVVHTKPIPMTRIWTSAEIEFHAPVSLPDYYISYRPPSPPGPKVTLGPVPNGPFRFAAAHRTDIPGIARPRSAVRRESAWDRWAHLDAPPVNDNLRGPRAPEPENDAEVIWSTGAAAPNGFNGAIKGFEYSLAYEIMPNGADITLEARKGGGEGEGEDIAKKPCDIASDNLDVRFKARADLANFDVDGVLAIGNGNSTRPRFSSGI